MKPQQKKFYLGVEGGGTKSTAVLVNENDVVLGQREGKSISYHSVGEQKVKANIASLLGPLLKKTAGAKTRIVFGLAGLNTPKEETLYKKIIRSVLPRDCAFNVVNDAKIALESRCPNVKNRILVISGTGSSVYGESGKKSAKTIGWDYLVADEGSGYQFGLQASRAVIQAWDGRGEKTVLQKLLLKTMKVKNVEDLLAKIYNDIINKQKSPKYYFASLAPLIDEAIESNDQVALRIRKEAGQELVKGVWAVANRLQITKKSFGLGFMGSTWNMPGFQSQFKNEVKKQFPKVWFSNIDEPCIWGAVLLAKKLK